MTIDHAQPYREERYLAKAWRTSLGLAMVTRFTASQPIGPSCQTETANWHDEEQPKVVHGFRSFRRRLAPLCRAELISTQIISSTVVGRMEDSIDTSSEVMGFVNKMLMSTGTRNK